MRIPQSIFLLCAVILLSAASCSTERSADGVIHKGPVTTNYMSVNIVSDIEDSDTRANDNEHKTDDGTYVVGDENAITSVRFYFFDANGKAANVKRDGNNLVNYLDWTKYETSDPAADGDYNVEKVINAQVIINTQQGDELPAQIVAVVNMPNSAPAPDGITDLDKLDEVASDYSVAASAGAGSHYFVMSNSVYLDDNGKKAEAVSVSNHLYNNANDATKNPVTIYVERVNAKVTTDCTGLTPVTGKDNTYDTGVEVKNLTNDNLTDGKIYVKFLGWDVTQAPDKSYLMKHIDEGWWTSSNVFGSASLLKWNIPGRNRSFWAINPTLVEPTSDDSNYVYKSFNQHTTDAVKKFDGKTYLYIQENASKNKESECAYPTQLIVAAQLVNENGDALTICEYGFFQYTIEGLKTAMANKATIYKKNGTGFVTIDEDDIVLLTATEAGQASQTEEGRYYVYAAIKGTGENGITFDSETKTTEYYTSSEQNAQPATYKAINAQLVTDCGPAKVWQDGNTYYYVDIKHLGDEGSYGWKGIVRNHIYSLAIKSLSGLGTPVYKPEEVIYPEKPSTEDTYIGAEVKVLTWRLVRGEVNFAW